MIGGILDEKILDMEMVNTSLPTWVNIPLEVAISWIGQAPEIQTYGILQYKRLGGISDSAGNPLYLYVGRFDSLSENV
jgi:hypothetical protein